MGQDPGRVRADSAGASYAGTSKTQTPDQPRGHEKNHCRDQEAVAFAEGGCEESGLGILPAFMKRHGGFVVSGG